MEATNTIVSFKIGNALVDAELDIFAEEARTAVSTLDNCCVR